MKLLLASLLSVFGFSLLAEPMRGGGGIEGTILTEAKLVTKGSTSQRDLVLWLEPKVVDAADNPKPVVARVSQKKLNFDPHVLPIVRGSTVEFVNEDQVKHNVFLDHECCKIDVDADKGETKSQVFNKAGEYPIVCRLHPEMAMFVLVLDTPYYVRVELNKDKERSVDGKTVCSATFKLDGVRPGTYVLRTWNKKLKALEREVVITDAKIDSLDLVLEK